MPHLISALWLLLVPLISFSNPKTGNRPITVTAERAILDRHYGWNVYFGQVHIMQETTHLECDTAFLYLDRWNKLDRAIAQGSLVKPVHFWIPYEADKTFLHAFARTIEFYPKFNRIRLIGNAHLQKESNVYQSEVLEYDLKEQVVHSPQQKHAKTTLLIDPK